MPTTTFIQKLWLSFQLIAGVLQIHSQNLTHGDIKPNNIMLTSSSQLFITDFAPFKPTTISGDSLAEYTLYFSQQTQRCYLAPERLVNNEANIPLNPTISKADKKNKQHQISIPSPQSECKPTMDIFSLGCVLAQIFMDGQALFDLPALQNYRKGNFNPQKILKPRLSNLTPELSKRILELILPMIDLQPSNRGQISQIFAKWNQLLFPPSFGGFMFQLSSSLLTPEFALSDERILLIRYHFDLIWKGCFNQVVPMLNHAGSHVMYETMRVNESFDPLSWITIIPSNFQKFYKIKEDYTTQIQEDFISQTFEKWENNMKKLVEVQEGQSDAQEDNSLLQISQVGLRIDQIEKKIYYEPYECALIIIDWIASCIPNALHASTKLSAMEMLTALATHAQISDYIRFQRVLPFILHMLDDQQAKVRAFAVQMSIDIISTYKRDQILVPTDLKIFQNYIWPFYQTLITSCHSNAQSLLANELVRIVFIRNLPKLVEIGQLFFEMSIVSRIELKKKQLFQASLHHQQANEQSNMSLDLSYISSADKNAQDDLLSSSSLKKGTQKVNEPISTEIVETFDEVKDQLRNLVLNIISETLSVVQQESLQGLVQIELIKVLPQQVNYFFKIIDQLYLRLGVFLGHQKINNVIIPLILACLNKTNFLRKLACLDIITPLCVFAGAQTLEYFLPCLQIILCDSNELLVYRTLKIYTQLASLRLLSRSNQLQILESTSPFLLHPNMWIRSQMKDFLGVLFRTYNLAQKFCHLRPRLMNYTSQQIVLLDKVMVPILTPGQTPSRHNTKFDMYLYKPLKRELFDLSTQVGQNQRSQQEKHEKIQMNPEDAKAMHLLDPYLKKVSMYSKAQQEREKRQLFERKFMEQLRKCTNNLTQFKVPNKIMAQMKNQDKKDKKKEDSKKKRKNFDSNRIGAKLIEEIQEDLYYQDDDVNNGEDDDDNDEEDYEDDEQDEDVEDQEYEQEDEKSQSILHKNIGFQSQFQVPRQSTNPGKKKSNSKLNKSGYDNKGGKKKKKKRGSQQALLSMSDFLLDKQNQGLSFESLIQEEQSQSIRRSTILKTNMGLNYSKTQGASRILNKTRGKILRREMKKKKREMRNQNRITDIDSDKLFIQQALGISPLADQFITATLSGTNIEEFEQFIDQREKKADKQQDSIPVNAPVYSVQQIYNLGNNPVWYPSGILVNTLHEHNSSVTTISVASDQRHFATASSDGSIKVWNTLDLVNDNRVMMASTLNINKKIKKIDFFSNILSFAIGCEKGHLAIYNYRQSLADKNIQEPMEQKAFINRDFYVDDSKQRSASTNFSSASSSSFTLLRKMDYLNQGDMPLVKAFSDRSVVGGTTVFCMTQRGIARLIDLRVKNQAATINFGPEHGLPSTLCTDRYENCLYIGTLGGYLQLLDLRFMLRSQAFHWDSSQSRFRTQAQLTSAVPIFSLASFQPDHSQILRLGSANPNSQSATQSGSFCQNIPLLFVGRGGPSSHQIVLVNINTLQTEVFLTASSLSSNIQGSGGISNYNVNSSSKRVTGGQFNQAPRKQSNNLLVQNNSFEPTPFLQRQSSISNYSNSALMQKYLRNYISQPFHDVEQLMDEDRVFNVSDQWLANSKLRYGALKQSFRSQSGVRSLVVPSFAKTSSGSKISMPCLISAGGDSKIRFWDLQKDTVANRSFHISSSTGIEPDYVTNFFGDMYVVQERVKNTQNIGTSSTNSKQNAKSSNSSIMKGNQILGGLAKGFESNGFTSVGYFGANYNPKSSLTKRKQRLQNVSHRDCVLDMGIVAGARGQPYLVSCGRDSLVKIWS